MQHIHISEHTSGCTEDKTIDFLGEPMSQRQMCRPKNELFYHNGEFFFITYNSCLSENYYSDRDFNQSLFKALMGSKQSKYVRNERTYLNDELKRTIKEGMLLHREMKEINQIYSTCYNKTYCIYTVYTYAQYMSNNIGIWESYTEAKEYLKGDVFCEYERARFNDELENLYRANNFEEWGVEEKTVFKSIDELTKLLKK